MEKIKDKLDNHHLPLQWKGLGKGFGLGRSFVLFALFFLSLPFGERGRGAAFAQQLPFSSQYYTDPLVINPAYTGINENINLFLTHRSQWTGLAGSPRTSYFTIDGPIPAKNSSLGLNMSSDVTDILSRSSVFLNYSYKFKISDSNNLYVGLACGVMNNKIDFSKARVPDTDDPSIYQQAQNRTIFSADLGAVYVRKKLTVGFAVPQILGNKIKYPALNGDNGYFSLNRHFQGSVKYIFDVSKEKEITAYPLIMLRGVKGAPLQYDVNGVIDWKKIGWLGFTYHSYYALAISGGVRYRHFCVGYAYDIGMSKIKSYTGSSSEFLLGYSFKQKNKETDRFVKVDDSRIIITDLPGHGLNDTTQELRDQVKAIYDTNQVLIAKLKTVSDENTAEINRLKAELEKAKANETSQILSNGTDDFNKAPAAKLKAIAEANAAEINRLKAELEKAKANEKSPTSNKETDEANQALIAKLRAVSDENTAEIKRLKAELEKAKANENYSSKTNKGTSESKPNAYINIRLVDDKGKLIDDAQIEVFDNAANKVIAKPTFNKDGYSRIAVPAGNTYDVVITKSGYLYKSIDVNIPDTAGYEKKLDDITLQKAVIGKRVVLNDILFDLNKSTLKKESFSELNGAVSLLKNTPSLEIEVAGFTDNLGPAKFNQKLSKQRAQAVKDYLIQKGCDKNRITSKGYGSSMPVANNATKEGQKKNRRTEFKVLKLDSEKYSVSESKHLLADSAKTLSPDKKLNSIPKKTIKPKKYYRSKGRLGKNRIIIGDKKK